MQYIKIENNKIVKHIATSKKIEEKGWIEANNFVGSVGDDSRFFNWDQGGILKPLAQLISEGLVEDNRGIYYNTKTKEKLEITKVGVKVPEGYTDKPPLKSVSLEEQVWDEKKNKWVKDKTIVVEKLKMEKLQRKQELINIILEKQALGEPVSDLQQELKNLIMEINSL